MPEPNASTSARTVTVTLFADLRRYVPRGHDGKLTIEIGDDASVRDVLEAAGIRDTEITIGVNGELASRDTRLQPGDHVTLFSPMEGG